MLRHIGQSPRKVGGWLFSDGSARLRLRAAGKRRRTFERLEPRELLNGEGLLINEFLAKNDSGLQDEDQQTSDWIEVYNPTAGAVSLNGCYLTDNADNLEKWEFPDVSIGADEYLIVFASDKDRRVAGHELHTNFKLSGDGEYLALVEDDGQTVVHDYAPEFPEQYDDVSYGLLGEEEEYFDFPSPGGPNYLVTLEDVAFSVERGFYDETFTLYLESDEEGATIYYTLDGSEPSETQGIEYVEEDGVAVTTTTTLRAAGFRDNERSPFVTQTYIFLEHVLEQPADPPGLPGYLDFEMDQRVVTDQRYTGTILDDLKAIPTISLVMDPEDVFGWERGIYTNTWDDWRPPVSVEMFDGQGQTCFATNCGVEIHGALSQNQSYSLKQSFRLHFKPGYGDPELDYALFGEAADDTIEIVVLRGGSSDSWAMRGDPLAYRETYLNDRWAAETQAEMGGLAPHGTWVHLYVNGFYWGLYNPVERPREDFAASYLGGESDDYDIMKHGTPQDEEPQPWKDLFDGLLPAVAADPGDQQAYEGVGAMLDIPAFIDYMLVNQFAGNRDWPGNNWYASREREEGAKWRFHSWDAEFGLSRDNQSLPGLGGGRNAGGILGTLRYVEEFQLLFADHVHRHLRNGGVLTVDANAAHINELADEISEAMVAESARWGDGSEGLAPHQYGFDPENPDLWTRDDKWDALLWSGDDRGIVNPYYYPENALVGDEDYHTAHPGESYFEVRAAYDPAQQDAGSVTWMYRNVGLYPAVEPAAYSQHGGDVSAGFQLSMTADAGTIYYTLDGSDPREYWTGAIQGTEYTGPITLNESVIVKARVLDGAEWSALTEAAFAVDDVAVAHDLMVTEINYHPYDPTPEELATQSPVVRDFVSSDFEFIELRNTGNAPIDLTRMKFTEGIFFSFSLSDTTELQPAESLVLVADTEAFARRYGPDVPLAGVFQGDLDDAGEVLTLTDRDGQTVLSFEYGDSEQRNWADEADGGGYTLQLSDPADVPAAEPERTERLENGLYWQGSWEYGGTPGNVQVMYWDGLGDGNWYDLRWVDAEASPLSTVPNQFKHAVVRNDHVTIAPDASVRGLEVESGQVTVSNAVVLDVGGKLVLGPGAGGQLTIDGQLVMPEQMHYVPELDETDTGQAHAGDTAT